VIRLQNLSQEMNGTPVAMAIKQMTPDNPGILVTGFADVMETTGEELAGVDLTISKPFTQERFREVLVEVIQVI